jgi:putative membrane protein
VAIGVLQAAALMAVLLLQLTSTGGTYPVQTSPGFFAEPMIVSGTGL